MKDGNYGAENPEVKGGWDGIVGELVRRVSYKLTALAVAIELILCCDSHANRKRTLRLPP